MEEEKTNKLCVSFILDVPDKIEDSNFNTLILRLDRLRYSFKQNLTKIDIDLHNRNIEEMQTLLETFKVIFYDEGNKNELRN